MGTGNGNLAADPPSGPTGHYSVPPRAAAFLTLQQQQQQQQQELATQQSGQWFNCALPTVPTVPVMQQQLGPARMTNSFGSLWSHAQQQHGYGGFEHRVSSIPPPLLNSQEISHPAQLNSIQATHSQPLNGDRGVLNNSTEIPRSNNGGVVSKSLMAAGLKDANSSNRIVDADQSIGSSNAGIRDQMSPGRPGIRNATSPHVSALLANQLSPANPLAMRCSALAGNMSPNRSAVLLPDFLHSPKRSTPPMTRRTVLM